MARIILTFVVFIVSSTALEAASPAGESDETLSKSNAIVTATWKDTSRANHASKDNDYTATIAVDGVVAGDIKKGDLHIKLGYCVYWSKDKPRIMQQGSSEAMGDADVTKRSIWFLQKDAKAWVLVGYRSVQPIELYDYFVSQRSGKFEKELPTLFKSKDEVVVERCIQTVCGGRLPGIFWNNFDVEETEPYSSGLKYVSQVAMDEKRTGNLRGIATAAIAEQTSKPKSFLEKQLASRDPDVAGVALLYLLSGRHNISIDQLQTAAAKVKDGYLAENIIREIVRQNDEKLVAILINFLEFDSGSGYGYVAIEAHDAIKCVAGIELPYHRDRAKVLWDAVAPSPKGKERERKLMEKEGKGQRLDAVAKMKGNNMIVTITNQGDAPVTITDRPTEVVIKARGEAVGISLYDYESLKRSRPESITLESKKECAFTVDMSGRLLHGAQLSTAIADGITLDYTYLSEDRSANRWIGSLKVKIIRE